MVCLCSWDDPTRNGRNDRQRTFGSVRPVKMQISLGIRAVWSESSLDAKFVDADNKDFDQTVDAQAYLRPRRVHMLEGTFSVIAAKLWNILYYIRLW